MPVEINSKDGRAIRKLIPLATLSKSHFTSICNEISIEECVEGITIFNKEDKNEELIYLLNGEVTLQAGEFKFETIIGSSEGARFALAHQMPRQIDAYAETEIRYIRIAPELIQNHEKQISSDLSKADSSTSEDDSEDWMTALLKSPVFQSIPASNLQKIIIGLKHVEFQAGEMLVEQGKKADYYFLVKQGQCRMMRKPSPNAKAINFGLLQENDTFGEDSLLSGEASHYSVTAVTDGSVIRLDRDKFISLIKNPVLNYIERESIAQEIGAGSILLDVRGPDHYKSNHIEGSVNIPFFSLKMQVRSLNRKNKIIVICEDGKTSEAAAFFLIRNKFRALILDGGIKGMPTHEDDGTVKKSSLDEDDGVIEAFDTKKLSPIQAAVDQIKVDDINHEDSSLSSQLMALKNENERLDKVNKVLQKKCADLKQEKQKAGLQIKKLSTQLVKLREALTRYQVGAQN